MFFGTEGVFVHVYYGKYILVFSKIIFDYNKTSVYFPGDKQHYTRTSYLTLIVVTLIVVTLIPFIEICCRYFDLISLSFPSGH